MIPLQVSPDDDVAVGGRVGIVVGIDPGKTVSVLYTSGNMRGTVERVKPPQILRVWPYSPPSESKGG